MAKMRRRDKNKLIDRLLDQSAFLLVAFLVNTGLFGGSAYLLLSLPGEIATVAQELAELEIRVADSETYSEMLGKWQSGWISERAETDPEDHVFSAAIRNLNPDSLKPTTVDSLVEWAGIVRNRLYLERSAISGFRLSPEHEENLRVCKYFCVSGHDVYSFEGGYTWSTSATKQTSSLMS